MNGDGRTIYGCDETQKSSDDLILRSLAEAQTEQIIHDAVEERPDEPHTPGVQNPAGTYETESPPVERRPVVQEPSRRQIVERKAVKHQDVEQETFEGEPAPPSERRIVRRHCTPYKPPASKTATSIFFKFTAALVCACLAVAIWIADRCRRRRDW